jgi:HK97 family phage major capsid protein
MPLTYEQMIAEREQVHAAVNALKAKIAAEGREQTPDDTRQVETWMATFDELTVQIEREEKILAQAAKLEASRGRRVAPNPVAPAALPASVPAQARGKLFNSLGDFASVVHRASISGGMQVDPRLHALNPQAAAGDYISTQDGFPIPEDLRTEIQKAFEATESLVGRSMTLDTSSNEIRMPAFEHIPGTTGALSINWVGEGVQMTEQKQQMGEFRLPLHKVTALLAVSEEALADAPLLDSFLRQVVPEHMADEVDNKLMVGTGVGQPLGILNAPATIEVAKEGSQTADTINFDNVRKMWARMHPRARANSVWMVGTDLEAALMTLAFEVKQAGSTVGGHAIYLPMGAVGNQPYGTLFGRPVVVSHHSPALGDRGDIALVDWRRYGVGRKVGGVQISTSMHLWFDRDKQAYKFTYRVGGQPLLSRPIPQRQSGSTAPSTLSAFVTLAERA